MLVHIVTYISKWNIIEKNTDYPLNRFKTFDISNNIGIPTVLYMKPILQGITIQDIDLYKQFIGKFSIKDVVIGSIFKENLSDETVHFSNRKELFYNPVSDETLIKNMLSNVCNIYTRSSQVMQNYREKFKNKLI